MPSSCRFKRLAVERLGKELPAKRRAKLNSYLFAEFLKD
jgi:hypothetical protein